MAAANIERGDQHAEVLVLGAGPGGYTAAFRAADLGKQVVMIDSRGPLGGVCLNVGCIPSKALLHAAKVIAETKEMSGNGLAFAAPTVDLDALRGWKQSVVDRLTGGLSGLAKQRKVTTVVGTGKFTSPNMVEVTADDGSTSTVSFEQAIIAAGSEPVTLPFIPHDDPHRAGRRRRRHRADHPPAPHPLRNGGDGRRSLRGHHHRPLHAQEEGVEMTADGAAADR